MHQAVMVQEVIDSLRPEPGGVFLDATIGGGGHAREILRAIMPGGRLIGIDRDAAAVERSRSALAEFGDSVTVMHADFRDLEKSLKAARVEKIDGALFDLGLSSYQLEDPARGFAFKQDGPLDMRMDRARPFSARDVVNRLDEKSLADIIYTLGEERFSRRIARRIVEERMRRPIETTKDLVDIVMKSIHAKYLHQKIHPATRTFQAIRIYVNDEIGALKEGLKKAIEHLEPGARVCVISFHSLEDRVVKSTFKEFSLAETLKIMTKKPLLPSPDEIAANPRSRSAKLRSAERLRGIP